jgi:hypothetical protein
MSSVHFLVQPKELDELNAKLDRVIMYLERWDKRCHETNMLTLPVRTTQTKPRMARDNLLEPSHSDAVPSQAKAQVAASGSVEKRVRKPTTLAEALKSSDEHLEGAQLPPAAQTTAKKGAKKMDAAPEPTRKAIDIPGFASASRTSKKKAKTSTGKPDKKTTRKRVAASSESNEQEELQVSLAPPPTPLAIPTGEADKPRGFGDMDKPRGFGDMDTRRAFSQKSDEEPAEDEEELEEDDDDDDFVVEKQE